MDNHVGSDVKSARLRADLVHLSIERSLRQMVRRLILVTILAPGVDIEDVDRERLARNGVVPRKDLRRRLVKPVVREIKVCRLKITCVRNAQQSVNAELCRGT